MLVKWWPTFFFPDGPYTRRFIIPSPRVAPCMAARGGVQGDAPGLFISGTVFLEVLQHERDVAKFWTVRSRLYRSFFPSKRFYHSILRDLQDVYIVALSKSIVCKVLAKNNGLGAF